MFSITLICMGKLKEKFYTEGAFSIDIDVYGLRKSYIIYLQ